MEVRLFRYQPTSLQVKGGLVQPSLYPAVLQSEGSGEEANLTIATPARLPWGELWLSIGISLATLSEAYRALVEYFYDPDSPATRIGNLNSFYRDRSGHIVFSASNMYTGSEGDPRILRLSYGSPTTVDLIFAFPTAVWALVQLITKLYEFRQHHDKLRLEAQNLKLENEKLRREINNLVREARNREAQDIKTEQRGEEQLLDYGHMLTGSEGIYIARDFRFADQLGQRKPHIIGGNA